MNEFAEADETKIVHWWKSMLLNEIYWYKSKNSFTFVRNHRILFTTLDYYLSW